MNCRSCSTGILLPSQPVTKCKSNRLSGVADKQYCNNKGWDRAWRMAPSVHPIMMVQNKEMKITVVPPCIAIPRIPFFVTVYRVWNMNPSDMKVTCNFLLFALTFRIPSCLVDSTHLVSLFLMQFSLSILQVSKPHDASAATIVVIS